MNLNHSSASSGRTFTALGAVTIAFVLLLAMLDRWTYPRIVRNEFREFADLVANNPRPVANASDKANGTQSQPASKAQIELLRPLFPEADSFTVIGTANFAGHPSEIFKALSSDKAIGYATHGYAQGYHAIVHILVATDTDFQVKSVQVISQAETEGYNERFASRSFLHQFIGKTVGHLQLHNGIDAASGATVSCSAVANGVATAVDYLRKFVTAGASGASILSIAAQAPLPAAANTASMKGAAGESGDTLATWHQSHGVGCPLCHTDKNDPYGKVSTETCLGCHKNGFSPQPEGEKMLAEVKQQLESAPGGQAMLAESTQKITPAVDKSNPAVILSLQYHAIKDMEDARAKWATRAVFEGEASNPHISHIPHTNCMDCHHIHKKSEDTCGTAACHPGFTFKMR
jgi:Na+-translocating ferredoxin:NAD+ oxidoreductase RnfG subunit